MTALDFERLAQAQHAIEHPETPVERGTFAHEWVLPVMGACACVLVAVGLVYIFAAWWVA